jgi:hypothetical protein
MNPVVGHEGLFKMSTTGMTCSPDQIQFGQYVLANTFGSAEEEEAAARLIRLCQQAGMWCGVNVQHYLDLLDADCQAYQEWSKERTRVKLHNRFQKDGHRKMTFWYNVGCILTLGIMTLFLKRPPIPVPQEEPAKLENSFSFVYTHGPRFVAEGIVCLKNRGLVRVEDDVIFPTPTMLGPIASYIRKY